MGKNSFALRWAAVGVMAAWLVLFFSSDFFDRLRRERVLLAFGRATVSAPFKREVLASTCPSGDTDCPPAFQAAPVASVALRHLTSAAVIAVTGLLFAAAWQGRRRKPQ